MVATASIQPNMVYRIKTSRHATERYAATGDPVRIEKLAGGNVVQFHKLTASGEPHGPYTLFAPTGLFRPRDIIEAVCPLDEWPAMARTIQAERAAQAERVRQELRIRDERAKAAAELRSALDSTLTKIGLHPLPISQGISDRIDIRLTPEDAALLIDHLTR